MTKVIALALVAAGLFLGYHKLRDVHPSRVPVPPDYPMPVPPRVDVKVPNPLR